MKSVRCRKCMSQFSNRKSLYLHFMKYHQIGRGGTLQDVPWGDFPAPWENEQGIIIDQALKDVYDAHLIIFLENHQIGSVQSIYNFPIQNNFTLDDIRKHLNFIYNSQNQTFKLNMMFGMIMKSVSEEDDEQYRAWLCYKNEYIFSRNLYISKRSNLERGIDRLRHMDITNYILLQRDSTKWVPFLLTNIKYVVTNTGFALGGVIDLPVHIINDRHIISLNKTYKGHRYHTDSLCLFRCLTYHHHGSDCYTTTFVFEKRVLRYFNQYVLFCEKNGMEIEKRILFFGGIDISILNTFENCFKINVNLYNKSEDGTCISIRQSMNKHDKSMNLNEYMGHLSYITNFSIYAKKFQCQKCERIYNNHGNFKRHLSSCSNVVKHKYEGGYYKITKNIFQLLEEVGIYVKPSERFFPFFACYDLEAMIKEITYCQGKKLRWIARHVPFCVGMCSNIPGFCDGAVYINEDMDVLVENMISFLNKMSEKSKELCIEKWSYVFSELDMKEQEWNEIKLECVMNEVDNCNETEDCDGEQEVLQEVLEGGIYNIDTFCVEYDVTNNKNWKDFPDERKSSFLRSCKSMIKNLQKLRTDFDRYISILPCLGFNSSAYDTVLIARKLAMKLCMDKQGYVIKKINSYLCLENNKLRFLDLSQYLSRGISYSQFLKCFQVKESKFFWPYEWITDISKLDEGLPPIGPAWYSSLKGRSILGETVDEINKNFNIVQDCWNKNKMTSLRDLLHLYQILDVKPMVVGIENMLIHFRNQQVDIFKECVSLPSVSKLLMYRSAEQMGAHFPLMDKSMSDFELMVSKNIAGGLSIIMKRFEKIGYTYIRNDPTKICKSIIGLDANALYAHALSQEFAVGPFLRRFRENEFKLEPRRDRFFNMYIYFDYIAKVNNIIVHHRLSNAREVRIGPYYVDCYIPKEKCVIEWAGCYYHMCKCQEQKYMKPEIKKIMKKRRQHFNDKIKFLIGLNYKVRIMWECKYNQLLISSQQLRDFAKSRMPIFSQKYPQKVTEKQILKSIVNDEFTGFIECDIRIPTNLPNNVGNNMSSYQMFKDYPPLIVKSKIPFSSMSPVMKDHIIKHGLSQAPRTCLVSGLKAKKVLLCSNLLKWYLNHYMVVTKIHQVIETCQSRTFVNFIQEMTEGRRRADLDESKKPMGLVFKLLCNSSYGQLLAHPSKYKNTKYVRGEIQAIKQVNDSLFYQLAELDMFEEFYEIQKYKSVYSHKIPRYLGMQCLQNSKIRMLDLFYNCLQKFLPYNSYELITSDTDSAYVSLNAYSINQLIKPNLRAEFMYGIKGQCSKGMPREVNNKYRYFSRTCCKKCEYVDKREPGIFHIEWQSSKIGDECVGLASKLYILQKTNIEKVSIKENSSHLFVHKSIRNARKKKKGFFFSIKNKRKVDRHVGYLKKKMKMSVKGVQKCRLTHPLKKMKHILKTGEIEQTINVGFRAKDNQIFSYQMMKNGLTFLYYKRFVHADSITTSPLHNTLTPV